MPSESARRTGRILRTALISCFAAVVGGAPAPAVASEPQLVPRTVLFGNPTRRLPSISPDGTRLAYLAPDQDGVENVWVRTLGKSDDVVVSHDKHRGIDSYQWAPDSRRVLYPQDRDGDEVDHLFAVDLVSHNVRDLTPFEGVRMQNLMLDLAHPGEALVGLNLRDRQVFDLYRIDLESGALRLDTVNPGTVLSFTADREFVVRAATTFEPESGETRLLVRDSVTSPWRTLTTWRFEDGNMFGQVNGGVTAPGFTPDNLAVYAVSAHSAATAGLVEVEIATGAERRVVARHPKADVMEDPLNATGVVPLVLLHPLTGAAQAVGFEWQRPEWIFADPTVGADMNDVQSRHPGFVCILSRDRADRHWVIAHLVDDGPRAYALYDRDSHHYEPLFVDRPRLAEFALPHSEPRLLQSRDGLELVAYLTLPAGGRKNLPFVILPHGGPWYRDSWGFDAKAQLLANRGYGVLRVNYRGSTGLGKAFLNAGNLEFGRKMQDDLVDAVDWAIHEGLADRQRIAVFGASAGGYATLRALTRDPDRFACGVDLVGPSDVAFLLRSMPSYWRPVKARWQRRIGDVEGDEALNREISPLYHADRIRAPLLIGQGKNDPRVAMANSDRIVQALRAAQRPVTYVVYPDEGHGFARPENNLDFYGRVEEFLAGCLGGRAEPRTKIEGATGEEH